MSFWLYDVETTDWTKETPNIWNIAGGIVTVDSNQGIG
jgi:hypothetical protein